MSEGGLIGQLGINWKLFLSQAVNFFILFLILRQFVYKPLLAVIKKRNEKIREGLEKAEVADVRLKEVDNIAKGILKKADQESIDIIEHAKSNAKIFEQTLSRQAEQKNQEMMAQLEVQHQRQREEMKERVLSGAGDLVKRIFIKTVQTSPEKIDEERIDKAVEAMKNEPR